MPDAKLSKQRVYGTDLDTVPAAFVAQFRSGDIVVTVRFDRANRRETLDYLRAGSGSLITLQQFLQYDSRGVNSLAATECIPQTLNLRLFRGPISTKSKRPDAGVHEQPHVRVRSRL